MDAGRGVAALVEKPFEFRGQAQEYFRIWIVNLALTVATLGFYSPWAKVRRNRYLYGSTALDGHVFDYIADPVKILKGRLLALGLLLAYTLGANLLPGLAVPLLAALVLLLPYVLVTSMAFQLRNTTYRNIAFRFRQAFRRAYLVLAPPLLVALLGAGLLLMLLSASGALEEALAQAQADEGESLPVGEVLFTLFLMFMLPVVPWLDYARVRFLIDHSRYGNQQAAYGKGAGSFYWLYLKVVMVFVAALGVALVPATVLLTMIGLSGEGAGSGKPGFVILAMNFVVGLLVNIVALTIAGGYLRARRTNLVYDNVAFDSGRLCCRLRARTVIWLYFTNALAILASLGLLIPWAKIRMTRYVLDSMALEAGDLDAVVAAAAAEQDAFGEELGELLDFDLGL